MVPEVKPFVPNNAFKKVQVEWDNIHSSIESVQPRTLGKTGKIMVLFIFFLTIYNKDVKDYTK